MLNLKKGLAVALVAATALTFAPVSAFAGTLATVTGTAPNTETYGITMNTASNIWSYSDVPAGKATAKTALADENDAVVALTPSEQTGSVTFSVAAVKDNTYQTGYWLKNDGKAEATTAADKCLEIKGSKDSRTLTITAAMSYLRSLNGSPKYIDLTANNLAGLNNGVTIKVALIPHAVQMNNLKVTLKTASDTAYDRYINHGTDKYVSEEARPNSTQKDGTDLAVTQQVLENTFKNINGTESMKQSL